MKAIRFHLRGELHSFREPSFHTYHKTLLFPPKTTICGLFGAAMGLSPEEVNSMFLSGSPPPVEVGVVVESIGGYANDLWKIKKVAAGEKNAEEVVMVDGKSYYGAVIIRELLFQPCYRVFVRSLNEELMRSLFEGLQNPSWALSLGREDELVKVSELAWCEVHELPDNVFYDSVVLPAEKYLIDVESLKTTNGKSKQLQPPLVIKLPLSFEYDQDGVRDGKDWLPFLFSSNIRVRPKDSRSSGYTDGKYVFQFF